MAALLTELIRSLGGAIEPSTDTIQEHYSGTEGSRKAWWTCWCSRKFWKHACSASYRDHLQQRGLDFQGAGDARNHCER